MTSDLGAWTELDSIEPIDRTSMTAFRDKAFRQAAEATGRKRLLIDGLHTEICLAFATALAVEDGYEVLYVTDAVRGRSQIAHPTAIERPAHAGAVPTTALTVVSELFRDWPGPRAGPAQDVIYWSFPEVGKNIDDVGVAEAELKAATAHGGH